VRSEPANGVSGDEPGIEAATAWRKRAQDPQRIVYLLARAGRTALPVLHEPRSQFSERQIQQTLRVKSLVPGRLPGLVGLEEAAFVEQTHAFREPERGHQFFEAQRVVA